MICGDTLDGSVVGGRRGHKRGRGGSSGEVLVLPVAPAARRVGLEANRPATGSATSRSNAAARVVCGNNAPARILKSNRGLQGCTPTPSVGQQTVVVGSAPRLFQHFNTAPATFSWYGNVGWTLRWLSLGMMRLIQRTGEPSSTQKSCRPPSAK